jgi:ribosomal protein S18 acetylase RimI-like enzyme
MTLDELTVVRASPGLTWRARAGGRVVGSASAFLRPDDRWEVRLDHESRADSRAPLIAAVAANVQADLHAVAGEKNREALRYWAELGFVVSRREGIYLIPTDPVRHRPGAAGVPDDIMVISARDADTDDLRLLDDALRQDVPGSDGWEWDPADFNEETYGPDFDPATYLVAADASLGEYIGLARVWVGPGRPRLGLVAAKPKYRRLGLSRAMLTRVFAVLHERGVAEVSCEVDDSNVAALRLLADFGARRINGMVLLVKHQRAGQQ